MRLIAFETDMSNTQAHHVPHVNTMIGKLALRKFKLCVTALVNKYAINILYLAHFGPNELTRAMKSKLRIAAANHRQREFS